MVRLKTHFEQVPLATAKKIAEEEIERGKTSKQTEETKQKSLKTTNHH
jgi:hypothetical protein